MVSFLRRAEGLIIGGTVLIIVLLPLLWAFFFQPPWLLTTLSPLICPNAAYHVQTDRLVVALTIDDGPDVSTSLEESTTTQILSLLARYQAHATFFPVSRKLETPLGAALAQNIVQQGHELGNHFTDDIRSIKLNDVEFTHRLREAGYTLERFASIRWFRPAGGWCSARNAQTTASQGYETILGTVWPYDTHILSPTFVSWHILTTIQPGSVVILHNDGKKGQKSDRGQQLVSILENVLPTLKHQGYRVVSLSELESYGSLVSNSFVLPYSLDIVRRRIVSGLLWTSLTSFPSHQAWGSLLLICLPTSILLLWLGFHEHFFRWQWSYPKDSQYNNLLTFYIRAAIIDCLLPVLVEEFIFRLLLLPSPGEITSRLTTAQWTECIISVSLYVAGYPFCNRVLRYYLNPRRSLTQSSRIRRVTAIVYRKTFRNPTLLSLIAILGVACTMLYLQLQSIWPPLFFHWLVVASWLLCLGGYRILHPKD